MSTPKAPKTAAKPVKTDTDTAAVKPAPSSLTPVPEGAFGKKDKTFSVIGLNKTGAVNYGMTAMYKTHEIIIACDEAHPAFSAHDPARYVMTDEDNVADRDSILTDGLMQNPGVVILNGKPVCYDGSRRVRILRDIEEQQILNGGDPIAIECKVKRQNADGSNMTDADSYAYLMKAHAGANEHRKSDNPMSRARKMRLMLKPVTDEAGKVIRPALPMSDVCRQFKVAEQAVKVALSLFDLCPEAQAAVEAGLLNQTAGAHIAQIKDHDTQRALLARATDGGATKADRNVTRKMARNVLQTGELPEAQVTGDGEAQESPDYRVKPSAIEKVRVALKPLDNEGAKGADLALCIMLHCLEPHVDHFADLKGYDARVIDAIKSNIKPRAARK